MKEEIDGLVQQRLDAISEWLFDDLQDIAMHRRFMIEIKDAYKELLTLHKIKWDSEDIHERLSLAKELANLARESIQRDLVLAKLEAEVMALRDALNAVIDWVAGTYGDEIFRDPGLSHLNLHKRRKEGENA